MFGLTKGAMLAVGATVTAAVAGVAVGYYAWDMAQFPPPAVHTTATAPKAAAIPSVPNLPLASSQSTTKQGEVGAAISQAPTSGLPGFDVVRVEPSGEAVVAGRASPNAEVTLLDRGTVIAQTKADAAGQFAFLPPPLPAGDHLLALGEKSGLGQVISQQTVTVAVPKKESSGGLVVALTEPGRPTRILSDTSGVKAEKSADKPAVSIRTAEAEQRGGFYATGTALPGAEVKLYLNDSAVADVHAGQDGHWSLQIAKGMQPGSYSVRADAIDPASGKVVARAEVPFDYKSFVMAESDAGHVAAKNVSTSKAAAPVPVSPIARDESPNDAVIAAIRTVTVVRGDSLWRISRKVLGSGIRYTQIYAVNASQIRDPALIYPGQVLVRPQSSVN